MIAYLRGKVKERQRDWTMIEVHAIGYQVYVTSRTQLERGADIELYCSEQIREDSRRLYGFPTLLEREFFELLLSVSGVGPRSALAILGEGTPGEIEAAILSGNSGFFQAVSGIGKKVALKIIVELKSRFDTGRDALVGLLENEDEALVGTLEGLGYKRREFEMILRTIPAELTNLEARLAYVIRALGKP